jgi:hypothetical protein
MYYAGCFLASYFLAAVPGNTIPGAVAGDDATVAVSDPVILDGSNSRDDDGDMLSYQWSFLSIPETSTAVLADADMAMASFSPDQAGTYEIELIVNDGTEDSAPDTVVITAE